jgi:hypothetical protein
MYPIPEKHHNRCKVCLKRPREKVRLKLIQETLRAAKRQEKIVEMESFRNLLDLRQRRVLVRQSHES